MQEKEQELRAKVEALENKYQAEAPARPDVTRYQGRSPDIDYVIEDMFTYHQWNGEQITRGTIIRQALAEAVKVIVANVPPCPDRSAAIRKLREARMDCNSAITHGGKY